MFNFQTNSESTANMLRACRAFILNTSAHYCSLTLDRSWFIHMVQTSLRSKEDNTSGTHSAFKPFEERFWNTKPDWPLQGKRLHHLDLSWSSRVHRLSCTGQRKAMSGLSASPLKRRPAGSGFIVTSWHSHRWQTMLDLHCPPLHHGVVRI